MTNAAMLARRLDAERVVRLGEEEVERQRADQRERRARARGRRSRRRAAAAAGRARSSRCRGGRAAARGSRSRRAAGRASRAGQRAAPRRLLVELGEVAADRGDEAGARAHCDRSSRERDVEAEDVDARGCRGSRASGPRRGCARAARRARLRARGRAPRGCTWISAPCSETSGSRPEAEAVTRSTGTWATDTPSSFATAASRSFTAAASGCAVGAEVRAAGAVRVVADGASARPWNHCAPFQSWPSRRGADDAAVGRARASRWPGSRSRPGRCPRRRAGRRRRR